jgi:hypothetical protein
MSGDAHDHLANGLTRRQPPDAGRETAAVGLYAEVGSRSSRRGSTASPICSSIWCSRAPAAARRASSARRSRMSAATSTPATERDQTSFTAGAGRACAARRRADRRPGPAPHFDADDLEREKEVVLQELGEARDTPSTSGSTISGQEPPSPGSRSAARSSATRRASPAIGVDDLHDWRSSSIAPARLILVAAGKVDHDALVSSSPSAFGDMPGARAAARAGALHRRRPQRPARFEQAHLPRFAGAGDRATTDYYAARLFADAVGGGMSSRLFQELREERGLAYSVYSPGTSRSPTPACSTSTPRRRARQAAAARS